MRKFNNRKEKGSGLKLRVYIISAFFLVFFCAILARAFQMQVLDSEKLQRLAKNQHVRTITVQSKRGDIYDRNLKEMAVSIEVDSVFAQTGRVDSPREAARALAPILKVSSHEIENRFRNEKGFIWLKRQVDLTDEHREIIAGFEGIGTVKESRRYYPHRQLASNVIGFTGIDSKGLEGIELRYDNMLKGGTKKFTGEKDAKGRMMLYEDLDKTVPLEGMQVELTIDKTIQYIAEKELKKALEETNAKSGTALVMDPHTGEVLAMASMPSYDPNNYKSFGTGNYRNRLVADIFEPGSTLKLFLIAGALEEGLIKPTDKIYCENGSYKVADRVFHDTKKHGWLTVSEIMKVSSNIGSAKIGEKLGKARVYRYLKSFGFGSKTGIDLPGETSGVLRHYSGWSGVSLQTISFGQGISSTGIQLVSALSSIANGGYLMKPYIVKSIKDSNGMVISESNPTIVKRVVSEETAAQITRMLIDVTKKGGTGERARVEGFEVAGKTGTAQKPDLEHGGYKSGAYVASFLGFVPADNPRLAIQITIDEPQGEYYGGLVTAPVFSEIAKQSLSYMGVYPNEAASRVQMVSIPEPVSQDEAAPIDGETMVAAEIGPMAVPDFTGKTVRSVLQTARVRSFEVQIKGSGRAISQRPVPGSTVPDDGRVTVWFQ